MIKRLNKICFYYNNISGACSASILRKKFNSMINCIPIDYNLDFPFDLIDKNSEVWIIDYSLQTADSWKKLLSLTKNIIWIDHYKTDIESSLLFGIDYLQGIRDIKEAGCILTWKFCFPGIIIPKIVQLIGNYDIQKRCKFSDKSENFFTGLSILEDIRSESNLWNTVLNIDNCINKIINKTSINKEK